MSALVLRADARQLPLPDASVDLIVTSPPYYGLRSYTDNGEHYAGQIGAEETPASYIAALLNCTREWIRVLKPSGSLFVNLGDKYANDAKWGGATSGKHVTGLHGRSGIGRTKRRTGMPAKSLMLLPERYRIAAVDELDLIARATIVWDKPNGLPESVTDRVRRSHEDWVHLTKEPRYYSAVDAIRETYAPETAARYVSGYAPSSSSSATKQTRNGVLRADGGGPKATNPLGKLPGSVWEIPTEPLAVPDHLGVDHFAAFPTEWPRRIILGWSPSGICTACGEGRRPLVTRARRAHLDRTSSHRGPGAAGLNAMSSAKSGAWSSDGYSDVSITGEACACSDAAAPTRPAVVLDPFGGTGTTALVASVLGRIGISVDRSADYCRLAAWRTSDPAQIAKAMRVEKPPQQMNGQLDLLAAVAGSGEPDKAGTP